MSDKAAIKAFKQLKIKFKRYSFLERESDERQYNSPFVNLGLELNENKISFFSRISYFFR